nr:hypothetical protein [Tanacetum cinerariifolium]
MNCIEEIANDAKVIEIDNQLLVLIKRQVETELMLGEKFRDLCEEVSNFVKDIKDVVKEVEWLSCKDVVKETICFLRRAQKHELYMMTRLQMMADESHLSVRKKHTFENAKDLEFVNGLENLWVELLERTNERQLFITELEGLCPSAKRYKILECLNEDKKQDLIHLLEIRKREINADLQFVVGLSKPWDVLYNRVNEIKMLSSELNLFGGPLAVQCAEYLKQLSKSEVLRMLELRKTIAKVHI